MRWHHHKVASNRRGRRSKPGDAGKPDPTRGSRDAHEAHKSSEHESQEQPRRGWRKITAVLGSTTVVAGFAGGLPQVTYDLVAKAASSMVQPEHGGGEYYLAGGWRSSDKQAAIELATRAVNETINRLHLSSVPAETRRRAIQWILAGNLTPSEASAIWAHSVSVKVGGAFIYADQKARSLADILRAHSSIS